MNAPAAGRQRSAIDTLLDYIALGLLVAGPRHGYQLYQDFVTLFRPIWQAGRSKFYATLADLQERGWLDAVLEPQEGRPPRKVYHITPAGEAAFQGWLAEPVQHPRDVRVLIPARLRFFELLVLPGAGDLLDAQITLCRDRLDHEAHQSAADDNLFGEIIAAFRQRQLLAMIDWLAYCKTRFGEKGSSFTRFSETERDDA